MVCDHVSCALRGYGPDFRKSGPFASLRSVQGAAPLVPLCGYPCALAGKVHPLCVCTFPARLKPNTVTLDRLPDTAGRRSFVLPRRRSNTMDKSREELEKEYAEATAKLEQYQHRGQRYENRIRYYTQGERKKRNHRLITRGGAVESIAPEVRGMSERAFFLLMEKVFSLPEVAALVSQATDQQESG
ncbi:DUF3847 domain-containing protein [Collinsella sp. OM06-18AC]|nr:DUF3847 domain-containing protein [Collinsella sp. OM06-18AC]RHB79062.1 DUF3847 domain-containing protein [Collinsella sp. AM38-1BH]